MFDKLLSKALSLTPTQMWLAGIGFSLLAWAGVAVVGIAVAEVL